MAHKPVLYQEIIHALQPRNGGRYVDGTLGAGGHARGILEACAPDGQLLGLDVDPHALALARETLAPYEGRIHLAQASHISLSEQLASLKWDAIDGIVLDLGASSMQFDNPERGFSFMQDGPLDMRFRSAPDNERRRHRQYLRRARTGRHHLQVRRRSGRKKIARAIVNSRPLHTTGQLVAVIEKASPPRGDKTHPPRRPSKPCASSSTRN
jgi:16S rRNA (cytosine1402-N4)-methyltransferase